MELNIQWPETSWTHKADDGLWPKFIQVCWDFRLSSCDMSWVNEDSGNGPEVTIFFWASLNFREIRELQGTASSWALFRRDNGLRNRRWKEVRETSRLLQFNASKCHILGYQFLRPSTFIHSSIRENPLPPSLQILSLLVSFYSLSLEFWLHGCYTFLQRFPYLSNVSNIFHFFSALYWILCQFITSFFNSE